jgi:transcriptional regulator with XRE-family HTH domain
VPRPSPPDPRLAGAIRALREHAGVSQETIAHRAGLTVSAYARIERGGANPTWTTVTRIAQALGVTLAELGRAVEDKHQRQADRRRGANQAVPAHGLASRRGAL